jgi:expansin (peptidoglycan-binding protein)
MQGNARALVKDGANQWWFAVLPTNVGGSGAVTNVEVSSGNTGTYTALQRQQYNYWVISTGGNGLSFPIGIRVWQDGKAITGTIASMSAGSLYDLGSNF